MSPIRQTRDAATSRRPFTSRWRFAAFVAICLAISAPSKAQIIIMLPKPAAPAPAQPSPGAWLRGTPNGATVITFKWNQNGVLSTPTYPLPTNFVVCVKLQTDIAPCAWPGTWNLPAIGGTPYYANFRIVGYQYSSTPPAPGIPDNLLDVPLKWIVGACIGQSNTRCSFSTSQALRLSTKDLKAVDVQGGFTNRSQLQVTAQADNPGTTDSGTTMTSFVLWHVYNDGPGRCLLDVNSPRLSPNDQYITRNGSTFPISSLPVSAGMRIAPSDLIAIRPANGYLDGQNLSSQSLQANAASGNLATWTYLFGPDQNPNDWTPAFPASLAVRIQVDAFGALAELNEWDNWLTECTTIN